MLPEGSILKKVDLKSPATTVALLKMNAVVGIQATVDANNHITRLGVTCALCHSTVDNSVMPGIGHRKDGWPNRDLNVGAIIALSPVLPADKKAVYKSWGAGKYDPRYNLDGKNTPLAIPPAYGLAQVKNETYTAEGPISYWNAYVAVTQMGGQGNFSDPRLGIDVKQSPDMVSPKAAGAARLSAQPAGASTSCRRASMPLPRNVDARCLARSCAACHVGATGTDNNSGKLHPAAETGVDGAYAARTANKAYRTTPLRALWQHPPYFHDGSAADARKRRGAIQPGSHSRAHRRAAAGPRRVPEVALILSPVYAGSALAMGWMGGGGGKAAACLRRTETSLETPGSCMVTP